MLQGFEKLNIDGKDDNEGAKNRSEKTQQHLEEAHCHRKDERAHRYHHSLHKREKAHVEKRSKSPSEVGCFQRPKLPDEIKAQAAVRDDLGNVKRMEVD